MSSVLFNVRSAVKAVAVAGTAEALGSGYVKGNLYIKALAANTNNMFIGDSSVDATSGYVLVPGAEVALKDILPQTENGVEAVFDLAQIYADAAVSGEKVALLYFEKA